MNILRCALPILLPAALASAAVAGEITATDLTNLPPADVVILGEIHDNPIHHDNQVTAVRALNPAALVFEMLTPEAASGAPLATNDPLELAKLFAGGWQAEFYVPILLAAAPGTPVYGAELPRDAVRRAMAEGPEVIFGPDLARYGLDQPLPEDQQNASEAEQHAAHCDALPAEMLPVMVQGQRMRDAALAQAVVQAHEAAGGPVVVITGSGHARRDRGLPAVLAVAAPGLTVLSIGQVEGDAGQDAPYDLWLRAAPVAGREDPCAAFDVPPPAVPGQE